MEPTKEGRDTPEAAAAHLLNRLGLPLSKNWVKVEDKPGNLLAEFNRKLSPHREIE